MWRNLKRNLIIHENKSEFIFFCRKEKKKEKNNKKPITKHTINTFV